MKLFDTSILAQVKSSQWNRPIELNLPSNALSIASNMASLLSGETFILELNPDGTFLRNVSVSDYDGIKHKYEALVRATESCWPIKVEDIENYNQETFDLAMELESNLNKRVNAHLFIGRAGKGSFGWHKDEGDVFCYMIEGTKIMETESGKHELNPGDWLYMPEGLHHKAMNQTDTVMISFGTGSIKDSPKDGVLWSDQPYLIG